MIGAESRDLSTLSKLLEFDYRPAPLVPRTHGPVPSDTCKEEGIAIVKMKNDKLAGSDDISSSSRKCMGLQELCGSLA